MVALLVGCGQSHITTSVPAGAYGATTTINMPIEKIIKTDAEWQKQLTPEQYRIARKHGTERAFTGQYWNNHEQGTYRCVACDLELFSSQSSARSYERPRPSSLGLPSPCARFQLA